jgi:ankyrin repeat protein
METVKILIDAGADVNAKTQKGDTAMMLAAREGHTEIADMLKQAGARE